MLELARKGYGSPEIVATGFVVRVGDPEFGVLLIGCVHDLEGVLADKFVVTVHEHLDIVFITIVEGCIENVVGGKVSF